MFWFWPDFCLRLWETQRCCTRVYNYAKLANQTGNLRCGERGGIPWELASVPGTRIPFKRANRRKNTDYGWVSIPNTPTHTHAYTWPVGGRSWRKFTRHCGLAKNETLSSFNCLLSISVQSVIESSFLCCFKLGGCHVCAYDCGNNFILFEKFLPWKVFRSIHCGARDFFACPPFDRSKSPSHLFLLTFNVCFFCLNLEADLSRYRLLEKKEESTYFCQSIDWLIAIHLDWSIDGGAFIVEHNDQ